MRRGRALALALVAVVAVGGAFAVSVPDRPLDQLRARWAPAPSAFLTVDGMDVHLRDEGPRDDGEPIVLLHGTAASLHTWDGWTRALARRRRVIRLDFPGFGLTGPFPDGDYTMAHYVRFLGHFLDALRVGRCVLVGNSFGGNVAWHVALAEPGRVAKLILVDSGGYAHASTKTPIGFRIARLPVLNKIVEYVTPRSAIESSVRDAYGDPGRVTPALVDRYYELTLREGNRRALVQRLQQKRRGQDAERIRELKLPTLILWGGRDRLVPLSVGRHFKQDIAGSELVVLDELGHVPHEEDPARSLAPVQAFLQR
jgi:pimeloyl-ACP methyl ester carboxylesterase